MSVRVLAASAAALMVLAAGSASAAVVFQAPDDLICKADACFGIDRGVGSAQSISSITLNRSQLGDLGNELVRITFWSADGAKMVGDFGDFMLSVLAGDVLTLNGRTVSFDGGPVMLRIERLDLTGGGAGGGGGFGFGGGLGGAPPQVVSTTSGDGSSSSSAFSAAEQFTNSAIAAVVPEPATWVLMATALGGLGALARRRRMLRAPA
jgi:hypothetical protein